MSKVYFNVLCNKCNNNLLVDEGNPDMKRILMLQRDGARAAAELKCISQYNMAVAEIKRLKRENHRLKEELASHDRKGVTDE